jgi:ribonuclease III
MQKLGYQFKDSQMLALALSHKSFANESRSPDHNERLEFLGDAVLGLIITDLLYENLSNANEGILSKLRSSLVRAETLAGIAQNLELGTFVRLGKGEISTGGARKESIMSSTYEAIVGAVFLDGGLPAATAMVSLQFESLLKIALNGGITRDYKTTLQEFSQRRFRQSPKYKIANESGPDHEKTFEVAVSVASFEQVGRGRNKKEAEQAAASGMLEILEKNLHVDA